MSALEHENLWTDQVESGWSMDWYGLKEGALDCSGLFTKQRLHLIFNISGQGVIMGERTRIGLYDSTISMCFPRQRVNASRLAGHHSHQFIILSIEPNWLKKMLGDRQQSIFTALLDSVNPDMNDGKPMGHIRSMTMAEKNMAHELSDPPVDGDALGFWYVAKVTEIIALHLFRPADLSLNSVEEPFCLSRKRILKERVDQVNEWLDRHMEESLDLKALATHVGCAPHYLSRLFSKEVGRTISQQLRKMRVEKAAELMDSGRFNVTEAAFEVGYNSLSHFTKAFAIEKGVKPSEYLTIER